jgi:hypothetical protein
VVEGCEMQCVNRRFVPNKGGGPSMIQVDCGRCYPCLVNKRSDWTFRMFQETKYSESSLFLTLTYDETYKKYAFNHLNGPTETYTLKELSNLKGNKAWYAAKYCNTPTLNKRDLILFNKRLRRSLSNDLSIHNDFLKVNEETGVMSPKYRFWGIGEYGSKSERPHFHIIAWNIPDTWFGWNPINEEYYSPNLENIWDKGYIQIGTVTQQSIHYCAKYTFKGIHQGPHDTTMAEEPFALMSRNPGIGQSYINGNIKNYYSNTLNPYATIENDIKFRIPRYYRPQIWTEEEREKVTEKSRLYCEEKEERTRKMCERTGKDFDRYQEQISYAGLQKFKRSLTKKTNAL